VLDGCLEGAEEVSGREGGYRCRPPPCCRPLLLAARGLSPCPWLPGLV